jgi:hypothetical protein
MPNKFEQLVKDEFERDGWTVYTSGWPDLLCVRGDEVKAVECKSKNDVFRGNQAAVLRTLAQFMKVRTAHPGPGFGDDLDSNDLHLLVVDKDTRTEVLENYD